jgi:hypothetical protein
VAGGQQPQRHGRPHFAEPQESNLHAAIFPSLRIPRMAASAILFERER